MLRPGDYTVTGRFAGSNIGVGAHFSVVGAVATPPSAQPTAPQSSARPTAPATTQPGSSGAAQTPSWWPAALAGLLVLVLLPWAGIALLWRRRL
jgi:hypothetical protein